MANKLFITTSVPKHSFAEMCHTKYSNEYFKRNGWETKYLTDDWMDKLENYDIILMWAIQEDSRNHCLLKKNCLIKLVNMQSKHKYIILDYVEDMHNLKPFYNLECEFYEKHFNKKTKNHILVRYENAVERYFPNCNTYTIPYSINASFIPSFKEKPINKLLLTGSTNPAVYPMRCKILELCKTHPIVVLKHPGYSLVEHRIIGRMYLIKLNECIASVATCASKNYNYIIAKFFEVPASGALLFAYADPVMKYLEKYGFKDMVNMVTFNGDNLTQKIEYILDPLNREEIDKIRLNGYNLIKEKHTHDVRFDVEFTQFTDLLLNNK